MIIERHFDTGTPSLAANVQINTESIASVLKKGQLIATFEDALRLYAKLR